MNRFLVVLFLCVNFIAFDVASQHAFDYSLRLSGIEANDADYIPNVVIFKVKENYSQHCSKDNIDLGSLNSVFQLFEKEYLYKKFPDHNPPVIKTNDLGVPYVDLSRIYEYHYKSATPVHTVIRYLLKTGFVEYAEPHVLPKLLYLPNDPFADTAGSFRQYGILNARLLEGWEVSKGDSAVVVGIVDTGTDTDHGDLIDNIAYNTLDTIDGLDNDNDGFTDNYYGWDMGENDNDPNVNTVVHGSHVSGISSATTDNNVGIAGSGFKCRFLPVKIDDENGVLTMSYEGIVYAADHGCDIINCSWGTKFGNGNFGQDIVNYATINRDALVLAACGNDNNQSLFFPASYKNVLSIAATDVDDMKYLSDNGAGSNYNIFVDLAAPGKSIYSTLSSNTYVYSSGTSMASPFAAGMAAIVKSYFPEMTAIQVGEQLRVTADNIDTMVVNQQYAGLMGKGRANLYRALAETDKPSVRLLEISPNEIEFNQLKPGDDFEIVCSFINYLDTVAGLSIKLSCQSTYVDILDSVYSLNIINSLEVADNQNDPFVLILDENTPTDEELVFRLDYSNGTYNDFEYFTAIVNAGFVNVETERIKASIHTTGRLVYHREFVPLDLGFLYDDAENIVSCGGLMIGANSSSVSDNVYGSAEPVDEDFASKENIGLVDFPSVADVEAVSVFNDSLNIFNSLDVDVIQKAYAWEASPNNKFVIVEYSIINKGISDLYPLYVGFYADWDIDEASNNKANIDISRKLAYVFPADGGLHAGIKLLSDGAYHHYAIDNNGNGGNINLSDLNGFTTYEKFFALTNDRAEAGVLATGNDVSHVISLGPLNLLQNDTAKVAFALIAGDYLGDLRNSADVAQNLYSNLIGVEDAGSEAFGVEVYPNPFENELNVICEDALVKSIELIDYFGRSVNVQIKKASNSFKLDCRKIGSGHYFLKIVTADGIVMKKLIKK